MRNVRLNLIAGFLLLLFAGIIARLVYLQIIKYQYFSALAKGQQEIFEDLEGERGEIFIKDKEGLTVLATNKKGYLCYASPHLIDDKQNTAQKLSQILNLPFEDIYQKLQNNNSFVILKRKLSEKEVSQLNKHPLKGIYLKEIKIRFYPYKELASKVLGFVDAQGEGQYGIEGYFDKYLSGKERLIKKRFTLFGTLKTITPLKGADFVLTIDKNLQQKAEELLNKATEKFGVDGGQIIVVNPNTGKILALADLPFYDPNLFYKYPLFTFKNNAIQSLYEPGSTFKPITMASAINEGKVNGDTIYIDKGFVKIGGYTIYNFERKVWGKRTMTEVLEKSINTGAIYAETLLGDDLFLKYLEKFGIFEKTGVELEGEIFSENKELKKGYKVNFKTASFGQGIELTPLILLKAFTAIANGGNLMKLSIIDEIREGDQVTKIKPEIIRKNVISKETSKEITKMLVSVVENGFGRGARIPGYYIAGKTGTSQIPYSALGIPKKGYSDYTWQSFIGYFPAFDPQFLILVKLDNSKTKSAQYSAGVLFKEMAKFIIDYYNIPPDY